MWGDLLQLRRNGVRIVDLLTTAHSRGFTELSYDDIRRGLKKAAPMLGIPTRTALWLRRKHERLAKIVDGQETMVFVLMELLEQWQDLQIARADPNQAKLFRGTLETRCTELGREIFDMAEKLERLKLDISKISPNSVLPQLSATNNNAFVVMTDSDQGQKFLDNLARDMLGSIQPKLTSGVGATEAAIERFGSDNIRPAVDVPFRIEVDSEETEEESEIFTGE